MQRITKKILPFAFSKAFSASADRSLNCTADSKKDSAQHDFTMLICSWSGNDMKPGIDFGQFTVNKSNRAACSLIAATVGESSEFFFADGLGCWKFDFRFVGDSVGGFWWSNGIGGMNGCWPCGASGANGGTIPNGNPMGNSGPALNGIETGFGICGEGNGNPGINRFPNPGGGGGWWTSGTASGGGGACLLKYKDICRRNVEFRGPRSCWTAKIWKFCENTNSMKFDDQNKIYLKSLECNFGNKLDN